MIIHLARQNVNYFLSNLQEANCIRSSNESKNQQRAEEAKGINNKTLFSLIKK